MREDHSQLAERMTQLSESKLIEMLESASDYRSEVVHAATEEASKRGGVEALRQRVVPEAGQNEASQSSRRMQRVMGICALLIPLPDRGRFGYYPALRFLAGSFRFLAVLAVVFLVGGILAGIYSMI